MSPQELYLDLLIRCVSNVVYGDPSISPWHDGKFSRKRRERGEDWPQQAHTMIGLKRLYNLRDLCLRTIDEGIPGDFIETGVWRGGACILMRGVLAARGDRSRKVWAADSFQGLPPPDAAKYPRDAGYNFHDFPQLAISLEQVQSNFAAYGLLDEQVRFVKGWFRDTLSTIPAECFAVIRLDGDLYESTIQALDALYPRLSPGGFAIIDDYAIEPCRLAVADYRKAHGIEAEIKAIDWIGSYWRKPL